MPVEIRKKTRKIDIGEVKIIIGWDKNVKYQNGASVAEVAYYHEYGTIWHNERMFFRNANETFKGNYAKKLKGNTENDWYKMAEYWKTLIQRNITDIGLIDTGLMRQSVSYKVEFKGEDTSTKK